MTEVIIEDKKYVLIPAKDYFALQKKAALQGSPEKLFSLKEAKMYSKKLIQKWHSEKSG